MSKKRKKRATKKAQNNQRERTFNTDLDLSYYIASHLMRKKASAGYTRPEVAKGIREYLLAHPNKTSITVSEIVAYLMVHGKFTTDIPVLGSHNDSSAALTSSPSPSETNEINDQDKASAESTTIEPTPEVKVSSPPLFGERLLLLLLSKVERVNIPGDLEEEYRGIAAKHGARYAKLWYYKQVTASAWPMIRKAVGWGLLAWVGEWLRRRV